MCLNKVYIRDFFHQGRGNWFPCGVCKSCRQQLADRRSRRIRNHSPKGFTCYFLTLTYKNQFIPYVKCSDLIEANNRLKTSSDLVRVPIYRDYDVRFYRKRKIVKRLDNSVIDYSQYSDRMFKISEMSGICYSRKNKSSYHDLDKISIAYNPDTQKFIKRLRTNLLRINGENIPISYYQAPEYGPTTQRFHVHLLVWFPSRFSEVQIRSWCIKAWPYSSRYSPNQFCQIARSPASYLASYVNCDDNVSESLQKNFKLRPSHSQNFGYSSELFDFQTVFEAFKQRRFFYTVTSISADGTATDLDVLYPKYVINRYFPKFVGFSRLSRSQIIDVITNSKKYLRATEYVHHVTPNSELVFGTYMNYYFNSVYFNYTKKQLDYCIRQLDNSYINYYLPLGYSVEQFAEIICDYWTYFYNYLYKKSLDVPLCEVPYSFFNLDQVSNGNVSSPTISKLIDQYNINNFDCNDFSSEIGSSIKSYYKYMRNIKQRKLNCLT